MDFFFADKHGVLLLFMSSLSLTAKVKVVLWNFGISTKDLYIFWHTGRYHERVS